MTEYGAGTSLSGQAHTEQKSDVAPDHHLGTVHPLAERVWHWLHGVFPERQIYIRSHGEVQFFTFSPSLQATLAGLALIFLGWVSFASVNVIFKDHIIAAKDQRYQAMQSTYEARVTDLQLSYDELNGALVAAGDRFKAVADELTAKQDTLSELLNGKQILDGRLAHLRNSAPEALQPKRRQSDSLGTLRLRPDISAHAPQRTEEGSDIQVMPEPAPPQPRIARPTRASLGDMWGAIRDNVLALFVPRQQEMKDRIARHPALQTLQAQTARIEALNIGSRKIAQQAQVDMEKRLRNAELVMAMAGLDAELMHKKRAHMRNMGGPLLPLSQMPMDGIKDAAFKQDLMAANDALSALSEMMASLVQVPLSMPVQGSGFELTSDYGVRADPFRRHAAFHAGVDFGGPAGARVDATAPGIIVWAGPKGPYGNLVEIDHGLGLRTRYGHLSRVLVRNGAQVAKGTAIGRVGSTGRSTGPHVHYEVWLDNRVKDPAKFLEAGRHVLK